MEGWGEEPRPAAAPGVSGDVWMSVGDNRFDECVCRVCRFIPALGRGGGLWVGLSGCAGRFYVVLFVIFLMGVVWGDRQTTSAGTVLRP